MSLYAKIGRLIKQNKLYEIYNSNSPPDSSIENIISELLSTNKIDSQNILLSEIFKNNNLFSKNDFEEAQNLIKNCSQEGRLILISILEIQLSLIGNENNYIKYEKINDKIIEKNIYWVITKEIHKKLHRVKKKSQNENEFEEYCHCIHDQKAKYILGSEYNFKYENIDSIICKLKYTNKNIEFIAIKTIFITFYNIACEYIQKYMDVNEYNKNNNHNEYSIFENIINDFEYIKEALNFVNTDFKQSLDNFKSTYNIDFNFIDLFQDIFFNAIFHNIILGCMYIHGFVSQDENIKSSLLKILHIIGMQYIPLNKNISKILNIEDLFNFKIDLTSKIIEKGDQMHIYFGISSIEKEECKSEIEDEKNNESITKKEIIYVSGSFEKSENKKLSLISNLSKINMEKIFLDIEKNDIDPIQIFSEKPLNNTDTKPDTNSTKPNSTEDSCTNSSVNNTNPTVSNNNKKEESSSNNSNSSNNNNSKKKKEKEKEEKMNMENKSLDEIYEYISKDNRVRNKKKNKKRNGKNKGKGKKNNKSNQEDEYADLDINEEEDPIVIQFKNDINEKVINAGCIRKIKPIFSEMWIKTISEY